MNKKTGFHRHEKGTHAFGDINVAGKNIPSALAFSIAQNATQYGTEVKVQVTNSEGGAISGVFALDVYLSDNSDGSTLAATAPAGAITAKSASGLLLGALTASKAFRAVTKSDGSFTLQIIDDATPVLLYVAASLPSFGILGVSRKTVAGDYKP